MDTFHGYHTVYTTIDSGAEGNMMRESMATWLSAEIKLSSQSAHQADGSSPLTVVGEVTQDCPSALSSEKNTWPVPAVIANDVSKIRIPHLSYVPQARPVYLSDSVPNINNGLPIQPTLPMSKSTLHSSTINLDPAHILPDEVCLNFMALHKDYDTLFSPKFQGYNGAEGPHKAIVNMGHVPPQQR